MVRLGYRCKTVLLFCLLIIAFKGIVAPAKAVDFTLERTSTGVNFMPVGQFYLANSDQFPESQAAIRQWQNGLVETTSVSPYGGRYWFHATIKNAMGLAQLVINPGAEIVENITIRLYRDNGYQQFKSGYHQPHEYPLHFGKQVTLDFEQTYHLVVLFESGYYLAQPSLSILTRTQYAEKVLGDNVKVLLCLGIMLSLTLYNLFIFIGTRDNSHLFYALYSMACVWAWSHVFNLPEALFGIRSVSLHWLPFMLLPFVNGLFLIHFLKLKKYSLMSMHLIMANGNVSLLFIPVVVIWPGYGAPLAALTMSIWMVLAMYEGIKAVMRGFNPATYLSCAFVCLLLPFLQFLPRHLGLMASSYDDASLLLLIGATCNCIFLAFALADRFRVLAEYNLQFNENLEHKVAQRTIELQRANQHLEELAVGLRAASDTKNIFLANMSHEIRTPLTSIIGYADGLLLGDIKEESKHHAISVISQNGVHLLHLINDILDVSKIEANKLEIEMMPFELLTMLQGTELMIREQFAAKELAFKIEYQLPLPLQIVSDPTRLKQILLNLINNAIKFTNKGSVTMTVSVVSNKLHIEISDTGIGMSEMEQSKLFTAFNQVDSSISRKYGGTGLGLSIAKSLTNKLGGDVTVSSVMGQGSSFKIDIGLLVPNNSEWIRDDEAMKNWFDQHKVQQSKPEHTTLPNLSGWVLLAEDHTDNRLLFSSLLERLGLNVCAVDNGNKAVEATLEREFDLILMDIQMPEMDGIRAFQLIQNTSSGVPVVALTANAMKAEVDSYFALGFTDHLAKPIDRDKFVDTVAKYINVEKQASYQLDDQELDDIKQQYVKRLDQRISDINHSLANQDWVEIGKHAHAIKGSAGMFGFEQLGLLAAQLELSVRNREKSENQRLLTELLAMCDKIKAN